MVHTHAHNDDGKLLGTPGMTYKIVNLYKVNQKSNVFNYSDGKIF